jgi:hypothetical protein
MVSGIEYMCMLDNRDGNEQLLSYIGQLQKRQFHSVYIAKGGSVMGPGCRILGKFHCRIVTDLREKKEHSYWRITLQERGLSSTLHVSGTSEALADIMGGNVQVTKTKKHKKKA